MADRESSADSDSSVCTVEPVEAADLKCKWRSVDSAGKERSR